MLIDVLGGPFDGASIDAPWRTPPGLSLRLVGETTAGEYRLERAGRCVVAAYASRVSVR